MSRSDMRPRILVVEDEYFIADEIASVIDRFGGKALDPACSVDDAHMRIARHRPDGAVVDIHMRGKLDFGVARQLREAGVPFVFVSAYEADVVPADLRFVPFHQKPYTDCELKRVIQALVSQAKGMFGGQKGGSALNTGTEQAAT